MAAARGLAAAGCELLGADDRELPFQAHSAYIKKNYLIPGKGEADLLPALLAIIDQERPDVFLPMAFGLDASNHQAIIGSRTALLVPDQESFQAAFNNRRTMEECRALGIPCPRLYNEEEAQALLRQNRPGQLRNQVVVKPCADHGASQGLHIVSDCQILAAASNRSGQRFGEILLEEFIPGSETMETAIVMFDKESRLTHWFTTIKIRQFPFPGGMTAMSESTHRPALVRMMMPFFEKWCWKGPAEVEFIVDSRDNVAKVIEINPRFPGYIGFPIRCGLNLPHLLCRLSLGEKLEPSRSPEYPAGIKYMNSAYYLRSAMAEILAQKNRKEICRRILGELKGKKVNNNIGLRDWQVVICKILLELKKVL